MPTTVKKAEAGCSDANPSGKKLSDDTYIYLSTQASKQNVPNGGWMEGREYSAMSVRNELLIGQQRRPQSKRLARKLRQVREDLGLSQAQMAERLKHVKSATIRDDFKV